MDNKKKIMIVLSVALLVLIVIGSSYAYFVVGVSEKAERSIRVTTSTTDTLLFEMGSDITFKATQSEFVESGNNAVGTTTAKAILKANNETNRATDHYYFYLDINQNDFVYTSEEQTAELILTIKKPDNSYVTSIEGLEYVTVGSVSGFDITESTDLIKIVENKEIVATNANNNTTTDTWELTITFVNLDNNQNENAGKTFEAKMIMQKEKINNLFADYIKNLYTSDGVNGLYLHDSDLVNGANDNSLRYAGGDYTMTSKVATAGLNTEYFTTFTVPQNYKTSHIVVQYCVNFMGGLCNDPSTYYNQLGYDTTSTHYDTMDAALEQAVTDGYLNSGNINNFVCFGSDDETCPADNLYRIIGVFGNNVKLIKYEKAGSNLLESNGNYYSNFNQIFMGIRGSEPTSNEIYSWNYSNNSTVTINDNKIENLWSKSNLNTINLNTNYLNNIGDKWRNMITGHKYVVGGVSQNDDIYVSEIMNKEILNPDTSIETYYKGRVGLAYLNDFVYSIKSTEWNNIIFDLKFNFASSWMFMGHKEYTITRDPTITNILGTLTSRYVSTLDGQGNYICETMASSPNLTRPAFYLSSGITYVSGNGTRTNPYRIA